MNGIEESVRKILEVCRTESTEFYTHVSLVNPKGKFNIDRSYTELFWKNYCKLLKKVETPIIGIAEKPQIFLPILVDIDIKIKEDELDYGMCSDHVQALIDPIQCSALQRIL